VPDITKFLFYNCQRKVEAIRSAGSSVFMQTYIWKNDHVGRRIAAELKEAAERGVQVTVRKDLLGTFFELMDMLKGRASPVFTKSGLRGTHHVSVDLDVLADRDHSKYFIMDERVVIFGGMNIADEYHKDWHDYMVLIGSPRFAAAFKNTVLKGSPWPNSSPFVIAVNDRGRTEIRTALIEVIESAKKRIVVEHAYFSDGKILEALIRAAERGVQVDVVLPEKPGTHLYANRVTINRLLESAPAKGSRVFLYPRMSHAKVILADGVIAAVGSANLTPRSMRTSREVTLFVHATRDHPFIGRLRNRLSLDTAQSELVLNPFDLTPMDRLKALLGKYVW